MDAALCPWAEKRLLFVIARYIKRTPFEVSFSPAVIMFSVIHIIDVSVLLSFLIAFRTIHRYRRRKGLPYPPGPPGWPVIGNLLDVLPTSAWLAYTEFSKKYGMGAFSARVFSEAR